jgi:hypothetical protein
MARLPKFEIQPGEVLSRFAQEEVASVADAWMKVFAREPAPHMNDYMWHVFSYGAFPSENLQAALDAYAEVTCSEYVVLSNDGDQALITDLKPTSCSLSDYCVFPKNLAWTMFFTHEDGWLGPYFAKHPQFQQLNAENLKRIEKTQQAAEAKRKGYW